MWNDPIAPLLNLLKIKKKLYFTAINYTLLKIKKKLHFTALNYTLDYTLHLKHYIFIQVNCKLNIGVKSVTRVIVYDAKCVLEKFRVKSLI